MPVLVTKLGWLGETPDHCTATLLALQDAAA